MTDILRPLARQRLGELLQAMRDVHVLVVGDLMLDRYLLGDVERISPEAPVPVISVAEERDTPGGAANVAANVAALGARASLVGVRGDDAAGEVLLATLQALGVSTSGVLTVPGRPTTAKTRIIARGQQVARLDHEVTTPLPPSVSRAIEDAAIALLDDADVLLLEDYDKGVFNTELAQAMVAAAQKHGIPVIVDPKERQFFGYAGVNVFKPNRRELERGFGHGFTAEDHELSAARARLQTANLLLTMGGEGMVLVSEGHPLRRTASIAREVFDVSGAGDTVTAWLGSAMAAGADVAEAAWLANLAAGVEVGKRGTATVSPHEVIALWEDELGE
jgi:D-beta-D-heptose 7-phosphate kinase/D-beta-D-heptose 1-phosphate adenosyltransferase